MVFPVQKDESTDVERLCSQRYMSGNCGRENSIAIALCSHESDCLKTENTATQVIICWCMR